MKLSELREEDDEERTGNILVGKGFLVLLIDYSFFSFSVAYDAEHLFYK